MNAFDGSASGYDAAFTDSLLGRWLRRAVWSHLDAVFQAGESVLDLGCGTGEDAVWLARRGIDVHAIDDSPAMLEAARVKARMHGVADRITFARVDLGSVRPHDPFRIADTPAGDRRFHGGLSNFGALNSQRSHHDLAAALAQWILPGGRLALVVMGPLCPWEWVWYTGQGKLGTAVRRFRNNASAPLSESAQMRVWYPSPRRLRRELWPYFKARRTVGIGVVLPPTFASRWVEQCPRLFRRLAGIDRYVGRVFPGTWLNDHYLMLFERTDAQAGDGPDPGIARAAC